MSSFLVLYPIGLLYEIMQKIIITDSNALICGRLVPSLCIYIYIYKYKRNREKDPSP